MSGPQAPGTGPPKVPSADVVATKQNEKELPKAQAPEPPKDGDAPPGNVAAPKAKVSKGPGFWIPTETGKVDETDVGGAHVVHSMGWFQVKDNRRELEVIANQHLAILRSRCNELVNEGYPSCNRFTNDPEVFPVPATANNMQHTGDRGGIVPFPPNDQQFYICGIYDPFESYLSEGAKPGHEPYSDGGKEVNSSWERLCNFAQHEGAAHLYRENGQRGYSMGRVFQGPLDNGYFIEALNALTLRPALVRSLFYTYDIGKSIFIAKLFKHGQWFKIEMDDFVPVAGEAGATTENADQRGPICCQSEHFPHVLWPTLIEKACAQLHTKRTRTRDDSEDDRGGWEAIGAGGRVEDALVLLTGGVAGRFRTREVSADRLFIYLYEHQQDTLFVCRVNQPACELYGVKLNPYYPYAVNRATPWEGRLYVQVYCAAPSLYDGGLEDTAVPYSLLHCKDFPEHADEGFFWCDVNDFHVYFDTIIECHLTNSPPCAIPGMPPSRIPPQIPSANAAVNARGIPRNAFSRQMPSVWTEVVYANPGVVTKHNEPEFLLNIPVDHFTHPHGAEVYCSLDQFDHRVDMDSPRREAPAALMLKVYEEAGRKDQYKSRIVCKSNWLPMNHSMVGFHCRHACKLLIETAFPIAQNESAKRLVFRCYSSCPGVTVAANPAKKQHQLVEPDDGEPYGAVKWSMVGSIEPELLENPNDPQEFDADTDCLRKPQMDLNNSLEELKQECSLM